MIYGNVKAVVPLVREQLEVEFDGDNPKSKYRRGDMRPLRESLIFGVLTKHQTGYIPSVDICFVEEQERYLRDTYVFKSLDSK